MSIHGMSPEERRRMEEEKRKRGAKVAQSQASATPIQPKAPLAAGGMGPMGDSPLMQIGKQLGKQALGSALGPLGGILGGLFNTGGPVQGYSRGGEVEDEKRKKREKKKREAKARGEYEVADWFYEGGDKTDRRYPGHFGATSPDDIGAGWVWRNEPNYKLKEFYEDMAIPGEEHRARFEASQYTPQALQASGPSGKYISTDRPFNVDLGFDPSGKGSALSALVADPLEQGFYNPDNYPQDMFLEKRKKYLGYNTGGKIDYAAEAQKRVQAQNAALQAGAKGQNVAPLQRRLFDEQGNPLGQVSGDAIKGYANREKFQAPEGQDTFAGIAEQIQAAKAAGQAIDYNALAALQQARQSGNEKQKQEAMKTFLAKHPNFRMPGGSQGVVYKERNMGGPISMKYPAYNKGGKAARPWWMKLLDRAPAVEGKNVGGMMRGPLNPNGYNEGGPAMETPIKKVMDEQKLDQQARAFELDEIRKAEKHELDMKLKQQQFQQAQAMKRASATTSKQPKAPLAKK